MRPQTLRLTGGDVRLFKGVQLHRFTTIYGEETLKTQGIVSEDEAPTLFTSSHPLIAFSQCLQLEATRLLNGFIKNTICLAVAARQIKLNSGAPEQMDPFHSL